MTPKWVWMVILQLMAMQCMLYGSNKAEAGFTKFYFAQNSAKQFLPGPAGLLMHSHLPRWSIVPKVQGKREGQTFAYSPVPAGAIMGKSGTVIGKCDTHQECRQRLLTYFNRIVKMKNNG
ncbi:uncharacterized protein LOC129597382 isoform X2 [Paramacrobiotus metropolitanus]|uniref:uncharacterized protein LOC129597382 isoform X2 n=1 Tax=Paramacrobiotus metropolitanus TaxID=2943436 RepID=UPI00244659C2|nr:uncharacterized protein LOC129597382 isoform X2 [Paramacrobiotus metropolitanus]